MHYLEIFGVLTGLVYLYCEYQARPSMWFFSIVMALIYIIIYQQHGLYGYMGVFGIYLVMSLYGLYAWQSFHQTNAQQGRDTLYFMPRHYWLPLAALAGLLTGVLYLFIQLVLHDQANLLDLIITSLSILNMWMLSRKWVEQWLVLIIVNTLSLALFWSADLNYTFFLYIIYWLVSFAGYFRWRRLAQRRA